VVIIREDAEFADAALQVFAGVVGELVLKPGAYDERAGEPRPDRNLRCGPPLWEENTMKKTTAPISLAGSQFGEERHVCAFFNSDDEEYRVLLPFINDGFECGDKAVHVVNPNQRRDHLQRLAAAGIDPTAAEQRGQLEIRINTDVNNGPGATFSFSIPRGSEVATGANNNHDIRAPDVTDAA
jgi:hypothetical protein